MFEAMSSLTGGGGLNSSSTAEANGDVSFGGNAFSFKTNSSNTNTEMVVTGVAAFVVGFIVAKAVN